MSPTSVTPPTKLLFASDLHQQQQQQQQQQQHTLIAVSNRNDMLLCDAC
jgi:hypothetical protein